MKKSWKVIFVHVLSIYLVGKRFLVIQFDVSFYYIPSIFSFHDVFFIALNKQANEKFWRQKDFPRENNNRQISPRRSPRLFNELRLPAILVKWSYIQDIRPAREKNNFHVNT